MRVVNADKKVDVGNISVVVRDFYVALTFSAPSSLVLCAFLFVFSAHRCRLSERRTSRRSPTAEEEPLRSCRKCRIEL